METVSFTSMAEGTREDYELLARREEQFAHELPDRLLAALVELKESFPGYKVSRYEHSLQSATRALRDGRDEEYVVAALLHDIGDMLAPDNHGDFAGAVLQPYVSPTTHWMIVHHGIFQGYYYFHHYDKDRNERERFRGHPAFERTVEFCAKWDQTAFDPNYDTMPLSAFEPAARRVFSREPWALHREK
jgi:predicted HD phosphohydrolase